MDEPTNGLGGTAEQGRVERASPADGCRDDPPGGATRREFLTLALVTTSGIALVGVPRPARGGGGDVPACAAETLQRIGEIASHPETGKLKAVIKIKNGPKALPGYAGSQRPMMRYFEGYDQQARSPVVWPADKTACLPGPTLRVNVGERVEITLLNQVDVGAFPGGTLDNAETGATDGCDMATNATVDPPDKSWYPGTRGDTFPNCFHGSSTANLHFHGTHVTPDGFGDNVLVQLRPDPSISEDKVEKIFDEVFAECAKHDAAPPWSAVPASYRDSQAAAVRDYDLHAIWKGTRGPVKDPVTGQDVPALPLPNQLAPANQANIDHGHWPQYFVGAFPNCFKVTEASGHAMGQAPGTQWYHAHKHGSTAINLFNGLAGALIIEGQYDRDLEKIYPSLKHTEKVLVVQIFEDQPNLERVTGGTRTTMTNGTQVVAATAASGGNPAIPQKAPTIVMRPGEVQLWRIVNAQVQNRLTNSKFTGPGKSTVSPLPKFRQIAQDGVQLNRTNYNDQPLTTPDADHNGTQFTLGAGGRIDILVQAPKIAAGTTQSYELAGVVNLTVCGDPADDPFPDGSENGNYPTFPAFLDDVGPCDIHRELDFGWEPYRLKNGPATNAATNVKATHAKTIPFEDTVGNARVGFKKITINANRGPYWTIDDEQFSEHKFYQTMVLGDHEEWKILNTTAVPHPFHIHVNPFQVVEVYDPNNAANSYVRERNGVWHDNVVIPAAKNDANGVLMLDADGKATTPGYVRIRSRFVDFTGSFVLHCHILAHEDRGMMQLVRVIDGKTTIHHH
jgi:FtsP/CotA-like multicopper oxidase with cupredoxin domain